jgi:hypothetical protein
MVFNKEDFKPVLPNITDNSMMELDADIEMVKHKNESSVPKTSNKKIPKCEGGDNPPSTQEPISNGKKVIIGILIFVIVVLVLLLIYQIYKYYTMDELLSTANGVCSPYTASTDYPKDKLTVYNDTDKTPHVERIPKHVRDLDNDVLSQYIKKSGNSTETHNARHIEHKSMKGDTGDDTCENSEMSRISKIIDETRESQNTEIHSNDTDDIPSREDVLQQLQKDMDDDESQSATLQSIEEEHGDNIINDFLMDDDTASIKSEDGGCQFEITKGKNKGQICGRKRVNGINCSRHIRK